jgi:hypothetical protein
MLLLLEPAREGMVLAHKCDAPCREPVYERDSLDSWVMCQGAEGVTPKNEGAEVVDIETPVDDILAGAVLGRVLRSNQQLPDRQCSQQEQHVEIGPGPKVRIPEGGRERRGRDNLESRQTAREFAPGVLSRVTATGLHSVRKVHQEIPPFLRYPIGHNVAG